MSRSSTRKIAELALARGAYRECLLELNSLLDKYPLLTDEGAEIGILMITAFIGKGENQKAISICETLSKHKKDTVRQQAKQFIAILKSPQLNKPKGWSTSIPKLDLESSSTGYNSYKKKKRPNC